MSRFDYVKYDDVALKKQATFKEKFQELDALVEKELSNSRPKSLILTKLEEAYMWVGKAIRDEQIGRNPFSQPQEERSNE